MCACVPSLVFDCTSILVLVVVILGNPCKLTIAVSRVRLNCIVLTYMSHNNLWIIWAASISREEEIFSPTFLLAKLSSNMPRPKMFKSTMQRKSGRGWQRQLESVFICVITAPKDLHFMCCRSFNDKCRSSNLSKNLSRSIFEFNDYHIVHRTNYLSLHMMQNFKYCDPHVLVAS